MSAPRQGHVCSRAPGMAKLYTACSQPGPVSRAQPAQSHFHAALSPPWAQAHAQPWQLSAVPTVDSSPGTKPGKSDAKPAASGVRSGGPYKRSLSCLRADWQPQRHGGTAWSPGCSPQPLGLCPSRDGGKRHWNRIYWQDEPHTYPREEERMEVIGFLPACRSGSSRGCRPGSQGQAAVGRRHCHGDNALIDPRQAQEGCGQAPQRRPSWSSRIPGGETASPGLQPEGQISPRLEMLHRAMAALRFVPCLQQSPPPPRFSQRQEMCRQVPGEAAAPGICCGQRCREGGGGSCPAAVGCSPRPARGAAGHVPRPKNAEIKLTLPSSGAKAGVKESQGRGREAVRTRKAAASVVNISHFNCFNDTLRDGCATQRVP